MQNIIFYTYGYVLRCVCFITYKVQKLKAFKPCDGICSSRGDNYIYSINLHSVELENILKKYQRGKNAVILFLNLIAQNIGQSFRTLSLDQHGTELQEAKSSRY